MAAAGSPPTHLRHVSLLTFLVVVLSQPGPSHLLLSARKAAEDTFRHEEVMTSLVVNQLAIMQMMKNVSDASCAVAELGRHEVRGVGEAEQAVRLEELLEPHLQQAVETIEEGHERRLQQVVETVERRLQVLEAVAIQINTTDQDLLMKMAELRQEMDRFLEAQEHQQIPPADSLYLATMVQNDTLPSLCSGAKYLMGSIGTLEVVASGDYPDNINCSWNIKTPVKAPVLLTWDYIATEKSPTCNYDWVKVNDLSNGAANVYGGGLCGTWSSSMLSRLNVVLYPTENILVSFHSDHSQTARGFRMNYQVKTKATPT